VAKKKALKTVLTFVQDETGSMYGIADQTRSAFNEYFKTLKNTEDIGEVDVQVWQFSSNPSEERVRSLFRGALAKVPKLTDKNYRPRGITPLLDAVGTAIQQAEQTKADRYLFIVQTDGLENASKDFTREQVAKLVSKKEKSKNWTLVFLGAGIDNWVKEAQNYGVAASSSVPFVTTDVRVAYRTAGASSGAFLRTNSVKGDVAAQTLSGIEEEKNKTKGDDPFLKEMTDHITKPKKK
jgi:hypothetical protein